MNKRCTNPSCRKTFSTRYFTGICPYCGKEYPQIIPTAVFFSVRILDCKKKKILTIKLIRNVFQIGLREAKHYVDQVPNVEFILGGKEAGIFIQALKDLGVDSTQSRRSVHHTKSIRCTGCIGAN